MTSSTASARPKRTFNSKWRTFAASRELEIEGVILEEFQQLDAPDVGTGAVAGRLTLSTVGFNVTLYSTFVAWIRGPVVARVGVGTLDDADLNAVVNRLALRMDQRIDGVLAGEIPAAPVVQVPTPTPRPTPTTRPSPPIGPTPSPDGLALAPDFQFSLYQGAEVLGAQELSVSDLRGKPLVLNFWAGSVPPSRAEMRDLQEFYDEYADRVNLLGLDVGRVTGLGSHQDAIDLLEVLSITYPAGFTSDEGILREYEILAMPSTVFLTAEGKVFRKWSGPLSKDKVIEITEEMLALSTPTKIHVETRHIVKMNTNKGTIVIELFPREAPKTVNNFVTLAREGFYDGVIFHLVIKGFMIQGGDPTGTGTGGPGYEFEDEIVPSLVFDRPGVLAMANAGPNTKGSQFFITLAPTPHLNSRHTIFGRVIDGQTVVNDISLVRTDARDKPTDDVVILSVNIDEVAKEVVKEVMIIAAPTPTPTPARPVPAATPTPAPAPTAAPARPVPTAIPTPTPARPPPRVQPAPVDPSPGLASWWPGDGNADDIWNDNDGTLGSDATFTPGLVSEAFSFDGDGDYVSIPDSQNLDVSSISVDAWINIRSHDRFAYNIASRWFLNPQGTEGRFSWQFGIRGGS